MEEVIIASASDAVSQLDMLVNLGWGQVEALGILIGCLLALAFYKGWLI